MDKTNQREMLNAQRAASYYIALSLLEKKNVFVEPYQEDLTYTETGAAFSHGLVTIEPYGKHAVNLWRLPYASKPFHYSPLVVVPEHGNHCRTVIFRLATLGHRPIALNKSCVHVTPRVDDGRVARVKVRCC